jgi:hypothetical protein
MVWIGLIWLRIGTSGGLLWKRWWTFWFHKMLGSSWVAAQLAASQEGLSSMSERVSNVWNYQEGKNWNTSHHTISVGVTVQPTDCQFQNIHPVGQVQEREGSDKTMTAPVEPATHACYWHSLHATHGREKNRYDPSFDAYSCLLRRVSVALCYIRQTTVVSDCTPSQEAPLTWYTRHLHCPYIPYLTLWSTVVIICTTCFDILKLCILPIEWISVSYSSHNKQRFPP